METLKVINSIYIHIKLQSTALLRAVFRGGQGKSQTNVHFVGTMYVCSASEMAGKRL
jgi:hypothetical protein